MGLLTLLKRSGARHNRVRVLLPLTDEGVKIQMGSAYQVDRLLWAVAEAHRERIEQEKRSAAKVARLQADVRMRDEAFVTEWQPAEDRPLTHLSH